MCFNFVEQDVIKIFYSLLKKQYNILVPKGEKFQCFKALKLVFIPYVLIENMSKKDESSTFNRHNIA